VFSRTKRNINKTYALVIGYLVNEYIYIYTCTRGRSVEIRSNFMIYAAGTRTQTTKWTAENEPRFRYFYRYHADTGGGDRKNSDAFVSTSPDARRFKINVVFIIRVCVYIYIYVRIYDVFTYPRGRRSKTFKRRNVRVISAVPFAHEFIYARATLPRRNTFVVYTVGTKHAFKYFTRPPSRLTTDIFYLKQFLESPTPFNDFVVRVRNSFIDDVYTTIATSNVRV